jgi:hypothetical protein
VVNRKAYGSFDDVQRRELLDALTNQFTNKPEFASGGIAGQLHLNRPGYFKGSFVKWLAKNSPYQAYKKYLKYVKEMAKKDPAKIAPEMGALTAGSILVNRALQRKLKEAKEDKKAKGGIAGQLHLNQGGRARLQDGALAAFQEGVIPGFTKLKNPDGAPGNYNEFMYKGPDGQIYGAETYGAISAGRYPDIYDPKSNVPGTPIVPTGSGDLAAAQKLADSNNQTVSSLGQDGIGKYYLDEDGGKSYYAGLDATPASTPVAEDKSLLDKWREHAQTTQSMKGLTGQGVIPEYGMQTGYDYQTRFKTDPRISSYLAALWQLPQETIRGVGKTAYNLGSNLATGDATLKGTWQDWEKNLTDAWKTASTQAGQNIEGIMAAAPGGSGLTAEQQANRNKHLINENIQNTQEKINALRAKNVDVRMAGTYEQNKQLMGDPRMLQAKGGRIGYAEGIGPKGERQYNPVGKGDWYQKMPVIDPELRKRIEEYKKRKGLAKILGV